MAAVLRRGKGPPGIWLLVVPGRRSGEPRSTPVSLAEVDGTRYLVAPYGEVQWVRNVRAAGRVTLVRGASEEHAVTEVGPDEAAPVLRRYISQNRITRPYFEATVDSPVEAFAAEAARHPVFRLG